jgi:polygalacturonase
MNYIDLREFGAKGDGITDDTVALESAMDRASREEGTVYFPPGVYCIRPVKVPSHITLMGNSAWGYNFRNGRDPLFNGRVVLSAVSADGRALLDLDGKAGTRITGLTLDGNKLGTEMHGIYSHHGNGEQNIVVEDCRICNFSGSGIKLDWVWVWAIRRSILMANGKHGIDWSKGYDGWIIDNQIAGNRGAGLYAGGETPDEKNNLDMAGMATVAVTANRIEWNGLGGVVLYDSDTMQFTGCSLDHNFGPAVMLVNCKASTISGCGLRSSGVDRQDDLSCHVLLKNCKGVAVTGNSLWGWYGRPEYAYKAPTPFYGFVLQDLEGCVVSNNALYHAGSKMAIKDYGGHRECVIEGRSYVKPDLSNLSYPVTDPQFYFK